MIGGGLDRTVHFGPFRLEAQRARLYRDDDVVHLRPKTWEVLCLLVANPGHLLTKQDIIDAVWDGSAVGDTMPSISVRELRQALGDDSRNARYIETVHRRGFRFIAELKQPPAEAGFTTRGDAAQTVPFVGRDVELAALDDLIRRSDPHCRVALVSGEAGIGKTTLLNVLLERIEYGAIDRVPVIGRGQCLANFGEGYPYLPVLGALRTMSQAHDRVLPLLRSVAPSWLVRLPALISPEELDELRHSSAAAPQTRIVEEMVALLQALGPVVWALEDLHWADEATLELVAVLAEDVALRSFGVIGTLRLAEAVGRGHAITRVRRELRRRGRCHEIMLEGLGEAHIGDYLTARFPAMPFPQWLPERLLARTSGNPLFVVTTVDHLIGEGGLGVSGEAVLEEERLETVLDATPQTLRELVQEEVATLESAQARVLRAASLAGLESDAATIAAALGSPVEEIDGACTELALRTPFLERITESARPEGAASGRYAFRHALYQKVIYEDQPPAARRQGHCRVGQALVTALADEAPEISVTIADHFERGGDNEQAVTYRLMAARTSIQRHALKEAALHLQRALALLPRTASDRDVREAEILTELGKVLPALQGFGDPDLQALYMRARALRAKGAEAGTEMTLIIGQLLASLMQRKPRPAEELAREMLDMAAHAEDQTTRAHAEVLMGAVLYHQGDLTGAIGHTDRALALAPQGLAFGPVDQECGALAMSGAALWQIGKPDDGVARALRGSDLARGVHPFNLILALQALAAIHQWRGDADAALATALELSANVQEQGIQQAAAIASIIEGWAAFKSGDSELAGRRVEQGLDALRTHGSTMQSVYLFAVAVEILHGLGRVPEAISLVDEADAFINDGAARWWEPELYRWRALQALWLDPTAHAEAEASLQRALDIAAQQASRSLILRASLTLAQLRRQQGRSKNARAIVEAALRGIEGGSETGDVVEAKSLLELVASR